MTTAFIVLAAVAALAAGGYARAVAIAKDRMQRGRVVVVRIPRSRAPGRR